MTDLRNFTNRSSGIEIVEVDKELFKEKTAPVVERFLEKASAGQKELYDLLTSVRESY